MNKLAPQQTEAFDKIMSWHKVKKDKRFVLAGYAGTGKTTLAKHIADSLNGSVYFCAYTGKAANVLREKGCKNTTTIHGGIYKLIDPDAEQPEFTLNYDSELGHADLVIVDEYSMLPEEVIKDLELIGKKVLYLGDPFQLPPVNGKCTLEENFCLTDVHRQALESNIIRYATAVRNGSKLEYSDHDDFCFQPKGNVDAQYYMDADQVIVGYNATRNSWNYRFRQKKGYFPSDLPQEGEKIICLRNNRKNGLFNGMIGNSSSNAERTGKQIIKLSFDDYDDLKVWDGDFMRRGGQPDKNLKFLDRFDYAYCVTAHKSQGSEWDNVLIYNEPIGSGIERQRWLYTALTRARKKVILVDR